jgi:nitrite reductase (NADH) large subunit
MRVLIIGNGIAGVSVAGALRKLDPDPARLSIEIFTREPYKLYSRIRLPEIFRSRLEPDDLQMYQPGWYEQRGIRVHKNRKVARLLRAEKKILLEDGEQASYDKLVLCMGASSARPPIPSCDLEGIFTIREYGDADALRRYLQAGTRQAIVLGGGLLGLEAAHHILSPALERLTVIEQAPRLLPRQLDETGASLLQRLVERWPCRVLVGTSVSEFLGRGKVEGVRLMDGRELPAQTVLISAGIRPRIELAREAGLVEFEWVVWGIIPAALDHAPVVAHNLLGSPGAQVYQQTIPQNTLKVAGIELASIGKVVLDGEGGFEVVKRYDEPQERYEKWVFLERRLAGALLIGSRENLAFARRSLGRELDPAEVRSLPWSRGVLEPPAGMRDTTANSP